MVEIASFNPPKRARTFFLIIWEIDAVQIRFKDYAGMNEARTAFNAS
mgnify:CR=1 FL=1